MILTAKEYLKYIAILYLLGVKGLQSANLDDLFSTDPILGEPWLRRATNRHDLGRFLRQVCLFVFCKTTQCDTLTHLPRDTIFLK